MALLAVACLLTSGVGAQDSDQTTPQEDGQSRATFGRLEGKKFVPDRVLVRFRPGKSDQARSQAHTRAHGTTLHRYHTISNLEVVQLAPEVSVKDALRAYRSNPDVLYAEPDYYGYARDVIPNDPSFTTLWGLRNTGQSGGTVDADIDATDAWTLTTGSDTIVVGIIDSGLDVNHPDLAANVYRNEADCNLNGVDDDGNGYVDDCNGVDMLWNGQMSDYLGHGTHVAGTIGAVGNNSLGVVGVNWRVKLLPCRWLDSQGYGTTSNAIKCVDYMSAMKDRGVNIVATNNSWGLESFSQALYDAIQGEMERGILFVAAAGNGGWDQIGDDNDLLMDTPSGYPLANVMAVAATTRTDSRASFSNYGLHSVHLGAPGASIYSTVPGSYDNYSGTSMATPHVVGTIALLSAYNPTWTWTEIRNRVLAGGAVKSSMANTITGRRLNAYGALTCANRAVQSRIWPPMNTVSTAANQPVVFRYLNINCGQPAGPLSMTINGQTVPLADDGVGPDQVAEDGIYSGQWVPPAPGSFSATQGDDFITIQALKPYRYIVGNETYRSITGTSLVLGDESSSSITSPFPVHFGGTTFTRLYVNSNGLITLDRAFNPFFPLPLPVLGSNAIIAPFWDDLFPSAGTTRNVYWQVLGSAPNRELVIEWRNMPHYPDTTGGVRFQVVSSENSDRIIFNYADVIFAGTAGGDHGSSASVGIQVSGTEGTQFSYYTPALTDGMSLVWENTGPDFDVYLQNLAGTVYSNQSGAITGKVKGWFGYQTPVEVDCGSGGPAVCDSVLVTPTQAGAQFSLTVSDPTPAAHQFSVVGTATDDSGLTHAASYTLNVIDFSLGQPTPSGVTAPDGESSSPAIIPVLGAGPFSNPVSLSCTGLPAGANCSFAPGATVWPTEANPVNVSLTIYTADQTPLGDHLVTVTASAPGAPGPKSQPLTLTVAANPRFLLRAPASVQGFPGAPGTADITIDAQDGYAGTVTLTCSVAPSPLPCSFSPSSVSAFPSTAVLTVDGPAGAPGSYTVTVTANDGTRSQSAVLSYAYGDYVITGVLSKVTYTSAETVFNLTLTSGGGYTGTVLSSCDASAISAAVVCWTTPQQVDFRYVYASNVQVRFLVPNDVTNGTYPIIVSTRDARGGAVRQLVLTVTVRGFTLTRGSLREVTIEAGDTAGPFELTLTPDNGYDLVTTIGSYYCPYCTFLPPGNQIVPDGQPVTVQFTMTPPLVEDGSVGGTYSPLLYATATGPDYQNVSLAADGPFTIHVQDFKLQLSDTAYGAQALTPGGTAAVTVVNHEYEGLAVPVQLSCPEAIPPGFTCTVNPAVVGPEESATVTVTAAANVLPSSRSFTITGMGNTGTKTITHRVGITFVVGDWSVTIRPSSMTVGAGGSGSYQVEFIGPYSYSAAQVECIDLDAGMTCRPPSGLSPGYTGLASVTSTDGVTPVGPHTLKLRVTHGGLTKDFPFTFVTQGANGLILTAPNGRENWSTILHTISWNYTGDPGSVKLELLRAGQPVSVLAQSLPVGSGGTGSYDWAIPPNLSYSMDYQIRISSVTDPSISDISDEAFRAGAGLKITSDFASYPLVYRAGGTCTGVVWYYGGTIGTVRVELLKGGTLFRTIASSTPGGGESWYGSRDFCMGVDWPTGVDYQFRVTSNVNAAWTDTTAPFSVYNNPISVTSPPGGEVFLPGSTVTINWNYAGLPDTNDVSIVASRWFGDSISIAPTAPIGTGGHGSYTWTIPQNIPLNPSYYITVANNPLPYVSGASGTFTIGNFRTLTLNKAGTGLGEVDASNGASCYPYGCNTISWQFPLGSTVTLSAYPSYGSIFAGWAGACTGTGNCTVLMDSNKTVTATFNLPTPSVTVTSPNGGESWEIGSLHTITWSYANDPGPSVKIELLRGGTLVSTISPSTPIGAGGNGSFSWVLPISLTTASTYTIRITSTTNGAYTDSSDAPFSILGPGVTVTSPNGGEIWQPGTSQTVRWTTRGNIGSLVRIDLYKNGAFNRTLTSGTSATSGSYTWTISATQAQGADYKIKVFSTTNSSYSDMSDANFTIAPLSITVTAPNGGELWWPGTTHTITWTSTGPVGTDVKIELLKGGVVQSLLAAAEPVGAGTFTWGVPLEQAHGSDYAVRITSNQSSGITDSSNASFTIDDLYQVAVTKAGSGLGTVTSSPAGINCGSACAANFSSGASITLTAVPNPGHTFNGWSGACTGTDPCVLTMDSDKAVTATFTAPPTGITVTAPNGGESWNAGTVQTIRWSYYGPVGTAVRIELLKGGVVNRTISTGAAIGTGGNGSRNWTVPSNQATGADYTVRVTSTSNSTYKDSSDAAFTINGPGIRVSAPNGGESFRPGTMQTIRWSYTGSVGTAVRLELYKNGVFNLTIISSVSMGSGGNGSFNWTIATTQTAGSDYKIKVTSTTNATYTDQSDAFFTIANTSLTVASPNGGELWRPGSSQTISWSYTGDAGTDVTIELLKGGALDSLLAAAAPIGTGGAGSYGWDVPAGQTHASDYAVRVTSNQNASVTDSSNANFTIDDLYQLSVTRQGTGTGTVASSPAGINCGSTCAAPFSQGAEVTLTATPAAGHSFDGWSGACTGAGTCTVLIDGDQAVTASFTAPPTGITVLAPNGGETLTQGATVNIHWSYTGAVGTTVKIELLKGGALSRTLSAGAPIGASGTGSFSWRVANSQAPDTNYRIRVTSTTVPTATDTSDGDFSIEAPF